MKIKTDSRRWLFIAVAVLAVLGGVFVFSKFSKEVYAESAASFEDFDTQLSGAREKLQELENNLAHYKTFKDYVSYQELWDMIDAYTATWKRGGVVGKKGMRYVFATTYDTGLYEAINAKLHAIEPDFQAPENVTIKETANDSVEVPSNSLVGSFLTVKNPTVSIVGYTMLHIAHIRSALGDARAYYDEKADEAGGLSVLNNESYKQYAKDGCSMSDTFLDLAPKAIYMIALYNCIQERNLFSDVREILTAEHISARKNLQEAISLLENGKQLASTRYFPGALLLSQTFAALVKQGIGKTGYNLEELADYIPNHKRWKSGADQEAIIAQIQYAFENEMQIARTSLANIDSTLTDLDSKSLEELVEFGKNIISLPDAVKQQLGNFGAEVGAIAEIVAEFDDKILAINENPGDKYFVPNSGWGEIAGGVATYSLVSDHRISAQEIIDSGMDEDTLWDYYGRLGLATLELDKTATRNLLQHEDWPVIEYDDEDEENGENSGDSNTQGTGTGDSANTGVNGSDGANGVAAGGTPPNTGVVGFITTNAGASIGIVAVVCVAISAGIVVYRCRVRR